MNRKLAYWAMFYFYFLCGECRTADECKAFVGWPGRSILYIVDGNIKGEYHSPADEMMQEKDRERMLNNWLMELGW